ncbi:MAG: hypothetical protein AAFN81_34830 [Bacteroidota bacterium]
MLYYDNDGSSSLYASSVEMVTDPDSYPIWRTKQPVIVVLNQPGGTMPPLPGGGSTGGGGGAARKQKHYYRYLFLTPGASLDGWYMHVSLRVN